jgi:hypothetical protein
MTANWEHFYSRDFPNHLGYGSKQIEHLQDVVLNMCVQVCRILKRGGLIQLLLQLVPMKTISQRMPVARGDRILNFLKANDTYAPLETKVRKVPLIAHIFGQDGAAMMLKKTAYHWRQDLSWQFDNWHACQRSGSLLHKIRQG